MRTVRSIFCPKSSPKYEEEDDGGGFPDTTSSFIALRFFQILKCKANVQAPARSHFEGADALGVVNGSNGRLLLPNSCLLDISNGTQMQTVRVTVPVTTGRVLGAGAGARLQFRRCADATDHRLPTGGAANINT